ncbi:DNA methylase [bacterium]|nr:DNA methylase [bacterium]
MDTNIFETLKDLLNSVKNIDGFPIGNDEDIITLSNPPFYTACPNPYIKQFLNKNGKNTHDEDDYHKIPFASDVQGGKHHPIYTAHTYHTKVPHTAIQKFIEHYTEPDDIVFDGFCGTGMTGVAATLSGRFSIISDLSPIATFISYNLTHPADPNKFRKEFDKILKEVRKECAWMYRTTHTKHSIDTRTKKNPPLIDDGCEGTINYIVWNDVFMCSYCNSEICFGESDDDSKPGEINEDSSCPACEAIIDENNSKRVIIKEYDTKLQDNVEVIKRKPILISYSVGTRNYWKKPDENDLNLIDNINSQEIPYWYPSKKIPKADKTIELHNKKIFYTHQLFSKRNLWTLSSFMDKIKKYDMRYWLLISSILQKSSRLMGVRGDYVGRVMPGTIYVSPLSQEINPFYYIKKNLTSYIKYLDELNNIEERSLVSTQSATDISNISTDSIDYIFTDPPFGANIMYSELNMLWESFLGVMTNNGEEAIINKSQNKNLTDYSELMYSCFKEMNRILKPNRWITVEFHNSKASVWNGIQEAMTRAGFIISQVVVLDKKVSSFNQINSPSGAVKNDLIINAYKPTAVFSDRFLKNAGEGMEVDFISQVLEHLPIRPNIGRTEKMLYSKMLAHYVENGFKIKYNSTNFYKLFSDNFTELDGYWFMDSQVKVYNRWKSGLSLDELREKLSGQQVLLITDEKSALTWMYYFLAKPRNYSNIYTEYQQVATTTDDAIPELKELLENNFILEDGKYRRPLSESEKAEVEKNHEKERERAFNKLLKQAKEGKGKIKNVRREALVYGFTKCYQEGRYQDILAVANKLYASTLEASGEIMDFVDIARIKTAGEEKKTIEEY